MFLDETFGKLRGLNMKNDLISEAIFATYQHVGFTLLGMFIKLDNIYRRFFVF